MYLTVRRLPRSWQCGLASCIESPSIGIARLRLLKLSCHVLFSGERSRDLRSSASCHPCIDSYFPSHTVKLTKHQRWPFFASSVHLKRFIPKHSPPSSSWKGRCAPTVHIANKATTRTFLSSTSVKLTMAECCMSLRTRFVLSKNSFFWAPSLTAHQLPDGTTPRAGEGANAATCGDCTTDTSPPATQSRSQN
jgi:hypothetical protein